LIYAANVVRQSAAPFAAIEQNDDLPFAEMIAAVPSEHTKVDLLVVTPGGSAQQVSLFVDKTQAPLRACGVLHSRTMHERRNHMVARI
jgi:hypothetical protein